MITTTLLKELSGNELKVYLLISTMLEDDSEYEGSQENIGKLLGLSTPTVNKVVNSLIEKELIRREIEIKRNLKHSVYKVIQDSEVPVKEIYREEEAPIKEAYTGQTYSDLVLEVIAEYPEFNGLTENKIVNNVFRIYLKDKAGNAKYKPLLLQFKFIKE